jgi:hypothetical protein
MIVLVVTIWVVTAVLIVFGLDNWSDRGVFGGLFEAYLLKKSNSYSFH